MMLYENVSEKTSELENLLSHDLVTFYRLEPNVHGQLRRSDQIVDFIMQILREIGFLLSSHSNDNCVKQFSVNFFGSGKET